MGRPRKTNPLLDRIVGSGNQRVFDRKQAVIAVVLEDEQGLPLLLLDADNLSVGGLYLRGDVPIRTGAHLLLRFTLPGSEDPIRLVGQVVRTEREPSATHPSGMGIRFLEVSPEYRALIEAWVGG